MLCRAKINLTLHVGAAIQTGRWQSYHPVESLVVFADVGDRLSFTASEVHRLTIDGPFSEGLTAGPDNLISKALTLCNAPPHSVCLTKVLPVASGMGGGSANAAAVLRTFDPDQRIEAVSLGADVPVCRLSGTAMMEGIGERVTPLQQLGQVAAVLVNPGIPVSTADIFKRYDATLPPLKPSLTFRDGSLLDRALSGANDLQACAIALEPIIADILRALSEQSGCELARMSGSGATCFGLFNSDEAARSAAETLGSLGWWAVPTRLGDA